MDSVDTLKAKVKMAEGLYLVLFVSSLVMIVARTPSLYFALTLGSAVALRILVVQPMKARWATAMNAMARAEDRNLIARDVQNRIEEKTTTISQN